MSFLNLVKNSKHSHFIDRAYNELSSKTQKAFLYTSLLYRYKIPMPANVLKNSMEMEWDDFTDNVIKKDGKNILIHENISYSVGLEPDLHFITRHDTISDYIIKKYLKNTTTRHTYYKNIINNLSDNEAESRLLVDILKAIQKDNSFEKNQNKLDKLYDVGYRKFSNNSHFLIQYSRNLQNRNRRYGKVTDPEFLILANEILRNKMSENGNIFRRDHRLVNRRAVICFELAKFYHRNDEFDKKELHIEEANDFFEVKKYLDPVSSYSFFDFIRFKLWLLDYSEKGDSYKIKAEIEGLLDEAKYVYGEVTKLRDLEFDYLKKHRPHDNNEEYLKDLVYSIENYDDDRPYKLILLYYHYQIGDNEKGMEDVVAELLSYDDIISVGRLLLKHYGRQLHLVSVRIKLFDLLKNRELYDRDLLRCHYYSFVAETYNGRYFDGRQELKELKNKIGYLRLNPDFQETWKDEDGKVRVFIGNVTRNNISKKQFIRIRELGGRVKIQLSTHKRWGLNESLEVNLFFTLYGIIAKTIE